MFQLFNRLRRDEEGQSLVIACVALLVLALGVMATVNIGRAIHQRMYLQNTADASAYSMAAMEARAFNYYAFTNRTQIVHYVSAMVFQSYLSFLSFIQALMSEVLAFLKTIDQCKDGSLLARAICTALKALPFVGEIIEAVTELIDAVTQAVTAVMEVFDTFMTALDEVVGRVIIPGLRFCNWLLWASAKLVQEDIVTDIADGYPEVLTKNDDQVTGSALLVGVLNETLFDDAHMKAAGGGIAGKGQLPDHTAAAVGDTTPLTRAKRTMGELTDATRYNNFVTSRPMDSFLPQGLKQFFDFASSIGLNPLEKFGQTKFVSKQMGTNKHYNYIHSTGTGSSVLAEGNVLGADDLYRFGIGPNKVLGVKNPLISGEPDLNSWSWHGRQASASHLDLAKVSVWAQQNGGLHWHLMVNKDGADSTGIKSHHVLFLKVFYADINVDHDGNHQWDGLTPFMNFDAVNEPKKFWHQPSTFTFVQKSYDQYKKNSASDSNRLQATERKETTGVAGKGGPVEIDTTNNVATIPFMKKGALNVISRGMAYYHRPGNWEEPPNFFNPYWRAKLGPVWSGREQIPILGQFISAIPGGDTVAKKILVH